MSVTKLKFKSPFYWNKKLFNDGILKLKDAIKFNEIGYAVICADGKVQEIKKDVEMKVDAFV